MPTPTSPATIYDVATRAGVSISTVSLALNTPARVSPQTRDKVMNAVDALGFVPKPDAVARARRGVGRIGVLAPHTSHPTVARRLNGVLRAADRRPLEIVLYDQPSAAAAASPLLASLPVTGRLDGLIVVSLPLDHTVAARLTTLRLPTVLCDVRHPGFDTVHTDDTAGGRLAAEHLLERGHRRFGFLGHANRSDLYRSPSQRRLDGYQAALTQAGHTLRPDHIRTAGHGAPSPAVAATRLLAAPDRPAAVFAADDTLAAALLRAAQHLRLDVPGDLAVIGYDDGDLAQALDLSTIRQPLEETGRTAMEQLVQRLEAPGPPRDVTLTVELIIRGTT
ncbi:LacI family DNA-binding transcriptional regulator [Sphaerisporangium sp. TRM90804]|uniref:LacI family DNA-binding transcriptional regulator n=1 Tax=Sphaerisporangium sp. TRM90804 TaxID=3031113 RepID=UPI00244BBAC3|nr:LacI family DNA-binding transcriptional regulator [Sphaerisporangium sp. TRM90804]MDH2426162.1 LacI family DNA-binding transcriptional regulator [Sphaerisporangium sp. TRM90804]